MAFRPRTGRVVYPSIHLRIVKDQEAKRPLKGNQ
jgi:hypothetical protein